MENSLTKRRAIVLSLFATATVNVLKFHPRTASLLSSLEAFLAKQAGVSKYEWQFNVVLFTITTFLIYGIIKSPLGIWFYNRAASGVRLCLARIGRRRNLFAPEDRTTLEF